MRHIGGTGAVQGNGRVRYFKLNHRACFKSIWCRLVCDNTLRRRRAVCENRARVDTRRCNKIVAAVSDYSRNGAPVIIDGYKGSVGPVLTEREWLWCVVSEKRYFEYR